MGYDKENLLEEKKIMIRIIMDYLQRAKESKDDDDKELRVKYAIVCSSKK